MEESLFCFISYRQHSPLLLLSRWKWLARHLKKTSALHEHFQLQLLHLYFTKCLIVIQNGRLHYSPPTCQSDNERGGRGGSPRQYIQQCVYLYVHGVVVVVETNKSFFLLLFLLDIIFSRLVCRADRESHYLSTRDCLNCSRLITGTTTIICKGRQVHPDVFISSSSLAAAPSCVL